MFYYFMIRFWWFVFLVGRCIVRVCEVWFGEGGFWISIGGVEVFRINEI